RRRPRAVLDLRSNSLSHPAAIGFPTCQITAPTPTWRLLRTHPADRHLTTHRTYESDRTQAKTHNRTSRTRRADGPGKHGAFAQAGCDLCHSEEACQRR